MKKQKKNSKAVPQTVSGMWILKMLAIVVALAAVGAWGTLCLIFWQGSWQLLYHPTSAVMKMPARVGDQFFEPVNFNPDESGQSQLKGWFIGRTNTDTLNTRPTLLYIHGATGNLGDYVGVITELQAMDVNVLAYDPRGFGQSRFVRPSEKHELEDAETALNYLTATLHVPAAHITVVGQELGANVALELAAKHSELGGVVVDGPLEDATSVIFKDDRSKLVPAHWLVADRYDLAAAAREVKVPVLWIVRSGSASEFDLIGSRKMRGWVKNEDDFQKLMTRWLDS